MHVFTTEEKKSNGSLSQEPFGAEIAPGTKDQIMVWGGGSSNLAVQWEVLCAGRPHHL
jgi:hypothetical protein